MNAYEDSTASRKHQPRIVSPAPDERAVTTYVTPGSYLPPPQTKSPQRVALERGGWLALGVAVAIAVLEGLAHTLEALNVGYHLDDSIRSGIMLAIPLIVAGLRAFEGWKDQEQASQVQ